MSAKGFVKQHYPNARSEKQTTGGRVKGMKKAFYLVRPEAHVMYIGTGDTEAAAWRAAKEHVLYELEEKKERQEKTAMTPHIMDARLERVVGLKLVWNESERSFVKDDINIGIVEVQTLNDDEFDRLINRVAAEIARRGAENAQDGNAQDEAAYNESLSRMNEQTREISNRWELGHIKKLEDYRAQLRKAYGDFIRVCEGRGWKHKPEFSQASRREWDLGHN